jgi:CheY-like chemotaxis protein/nitrogen-specific signal transduction histidine kinase
LGVSIDITEKKRAEVALNKAKNAAESASRAKSNFLAHMSHEIRTPLNAVIGMTELVLETELSAAQAEYLKMVRDAAVSLLAIISDVLDFSKIEAGKLELDWTEFDIRETLGDAIKSLAYAAHEKDLDLIARFDPRLPHLLIGDVGRLRQVIINLVGNAVKFTQQGEVFVDVALEAGDEEHLTVRMTISDTGIGIPAEKLTSIFAAFEQADSSTTRQFGGTGLGLAISSKLVELLGGKIWCESRMGEGSRFYATVRLRRSEGAPQASTELPARVRNARVLIVDDSATSRRVLQEEINEMGLAAIVVGSAGEGLAALRKAAAAQEPHSVVVVDADLKEVNGFQLAAQIQNDSAIACPIVMLMTARRLPEPSSRHEALGIAAYLTKPVKASELRRALLEAIEGPAAQADAVSVRTFPPAGKESPSLKILLAEDSLFNQKLAAGQLQKWGHDVVVVNNGREAVNAVRAETFDVVLMDIQMPVMDGLQAAMAIRESESPTGRRIPIIAMTAHVSQEDRNECLAAGMDDYVGKPVRSAELRRALRGAVQPADRHASDPATKS